MIHSVIVFVVFYVMLNFNAFNGGRTIDFWMSGAMMMGCIIILANVVVFNASHVHNIINWFLLALMVLLYPLFHTALARDITNALFGTFRPFWFTSHFYFGTIFVCSLVFTTDKMWEETRKFMYGYLGRLKRVENINNPSIQAKK